MTPTPELNVDDIDADPVEADYQPNPYVAVSGEDLATQDDGSDLDLDDSPLNETR